MSGTARASEAGIARCAVHPDVPAILTCPICGSYACPECAITMSWREAAASRAIRGRLDVYLSGAWLLATPLLLLRIALDEAEPQRAPLKLAAGRRLLQPSLFPCCIS